jgi:hypothetical protein
MWGFKSRARDAAPPPPFLAGKKMKVPVGCDRWTAEMDSGTKIRAWAWWACSSNEASR